MLDFLLMMLRGALMQGISRKILENHILFWPCAFIACGKENAEGLLKLSAEIGYQYLQCTCLR